MLILFFLVVVSSNSKRRYGKNSVIIVDIGINFVDGKLVGDVDFEGVKDKCSFITPVRMVLAMTIAMLMEQTIEAWDRINKL